MPKAWRLAAGDGKGVRVSDLESMIRKIVRDELAKAKPANDDTASEHLGVREYAQRWRISATTVREAIRQGRLQHERVGRLIRIPASARISKARVDDVTARARLKLLGGGK